MNFIDILWFFADCHWKTLIFIVVVKILLRFIEFHNLFVDFHWKTIPFIKSCFSFNCIDFHGLFVGFLWKTCAFIEHWRFFVEFISLVILHSEVKAVDTGIIIFVDMDASGPRNSMYILGCRCPGGCCKEMEAPGTGGPFVFVSPKWHVHRLPVVKCSWPGGCKKKWRPLARGVPFVFGLPKWNVHRLPLVKCSWPGGCKKKWRPLGWGGSISFRAL